MSLLQIYVAGNCWGSQEATAIAQIVATAFPTLEVQVVNIDEKGVGVPEEVFAVPTYFLEGQFLCLGNPNLDWLFQQVAAKLTKEDKEG